MADLEARLARLERLLLLVAIDDPVTQDRAIDAMAPETRAAVRRDIDALRAEIDPSTSPTAAAAWAAWLYPNGLDDTFVCAKCCADVRCADRHVADGVRGVLCRACAAQVGGKAVRDG